MRNAPITTTAKLSHVRPVVAGRDPAATVKPKPFFKITSGLNSAT